MFVKMSIFTLKDFKSLFHPHHILNIVLASLYLITKVINPFCTILYPTTGCELDFRETEILMFLAIIIVFRTRKQGAVRMVPYLSSVCMYTKLANILLFFYSDPRLGVVYSVLCLMHVLLLPEPTYEGPDNVIYFTGSNLEEEIQKDTRVSWLITFYTVWNSNCVSFAPVFAELSVKYGLDNLKFGKIDVTRYPAVAEKFYISTSAFSKQLPTIILFRNGKEITRRPTVDNKGMLLKFFFSEENVTAAFDLNNLHKECKENPIRRSKKLELPEEQHEKIE